VDEAGADDHQRDQRELGRLRAGVVLRAYKQAWPAIDVGTVAIASGPESWASFLERAAADDLTAVLAVLNAAAGQLP
jgi:hypothetical protein